MARPSIPTGGPNATPAPGVTAPGRRRAPPAAASPSGATPAADTGIALPVPAHVQTALAAVDQADAAVSPSLRVPATKGRRGGKLARKGEVFLPLIAELLRDYPDLAPGVDVAAFEAEVALGAGLRRLSARTTDLGARIDAGAHASADAAWVVGGPFYAAAQQRALTDGELAQRLAPIQSALAVGPTAQTRPQRVAAAATRATRAQQRAARAQQTADVTKYVATLADAAAEARRTGVVPAAPVPPTGSNPTR